MAWTNVTCSNCKEEYRVQMYGPYKTREWKVENWNGICDDCKEAVKAELIEQNKSGDMPQMTGSEKQIAWAMKIRAGFIRKIENSDYHEESILRQIGRKITIEPEKELIQAAIENILEKQPAHWWIDERYNVEGGEAIIEEAIKIASSVTPDTDPIEKELQAEAEAEAVMMPIEPVTETIVDITLEKESIRISFPEKSENFREIIKGLGYTWESPWKKNLSYATESTDDRLAEVGHELLAAGFCIRILNPEIKEKILSGNYEQEHSRWIGVLNDKPNHFYIKWRRDDNMYDEAKKITGSRYDRPGITVPMDHLEEILDFAEMYKFKFSPAAEKLIEKAKTNKAAALVVRIKKKEKKILPQIEDGIPTLDIPKSVEVDDELKD